MIYWKHPELYDELTEGEQLHSSIFQSLQTDIHDKVVLDAASGTGRATLECLRCGARQVYAVDPSPAALSILAQKVAHPPAANRAVTLQGCFQELPLENSTVDISVSCSAFKASETRLRELLRVTKPGGKIVLIWPRQEDYMWLAERGFSYYPSLLILMDVYISDPLRARCAAFASSMQPIRPLLTISL